MPEHKIAQMSGVQERYVTSPHDFSARRQQAMDGGRCPAHMTDEQWREFLREEQKEGMHPSLRGKKF